MRAMMLAISGFVLFGLSIAIAKDTDYSKKILGTWVITKGEAPPGATVEFTKDGKMKLRAQLGEKELAIDGTYTLQGDTITSHLSFGGQKKTETDKIKKLTDKELIVEDDKGKVQEYKRK